MTCPKCGGEVRIIDDTPMCRTCDLPLSNVTWERRSTQDYVYAGPERRADGLFKRKAVCSCGNALGLRNLGSVLNRVPEAPEVIALTGTAARP